MTAPLPSRYLSPTAALLNTLLSHYIHRADQRITDLERSSLTRTPSTRS